MASRTEGFDELIRKYAAEEFIEKKYDAASLRTIAGRAGVSTSAIYTRYGDKEGLFRSLTEPAMDGFYRIIEEGYRRFSEGADMNSGEERDEAADSGKKNLIRYIFDNFDCFVMLLENSPGDMASAFIDRLAELDVKNTLDFLVATGNRAYAEGRLTGGFIHVVSRGYYEGLFEVVRHRMLEEDAIHYVEELTKFFRTGWSMYF